MLSLEQALVCCALALGTLGCVLSLARKPAWAAGASGLTAVPLFFLALRKGSGAPWLCLLPLALAVAVMAGCRSYGLGALPRRPRRHGAGAHFGSSASGGTRTAPRGLEPLAGMFAPLNLFFALYLYLYTTEFWRVSGTEPYEYLVVVAIAVATAAVMFFWLDTPEQWGDLASVLLIALCLLYALFTALLLFDDIPSWLLTLYQCACYVFFPVLQLFAVIAVSLMATTRDPTKSYVVGAVNEMDARDNRCEGEHVAPRKPTVPSVSSLALIYFFITAGLLCYNMSAELPLSGDISSVALLAVVVVVLALAGRGAAPFRLALLVGVAFWGLSLFDSQGLRVTLNEWLFGSGAPSLAASLELASQRASRFVALFATSDVIGAGDVSLAARRAYFTFTSSVFPEISSAYGNAGLAVVLLGVVTVLVSGVRWVHAIEEPEDASSATRAEQDRLVRAGLLTLLAAPMVLDVLAVAGVSPLMPAFPLLSGGRMGSFRHIVLGGFAALITCRRPAQLYASDGPEALDLKDLGLLSKL